MAATLTGGTGTVVSHRSAAMLWGLLSGYTGPIELSGGSSRSRRPEIRGHEVRPAGDEVTCDGPIPVTGPSRTIFDLASVLSLRQLERAFNEAEVRRLVSRVSLPELVERYPGRRGVAKLRVLLGDASRIGITRSNLEEEFLALVDRVGLPRPRLNAHLEARGRFFEVDAVWHSAKLIVELDGKAAHLTRLAFESDRERDRILLAQGWRVLRITWRQIRDVPQDIVSDLQALLAGRNDS
ncbi:MAG TPA: DUF559 domain-containing protein [Solirubrobacterales bacterium]